jgi:hypothetical protein
MSTVARSTAAVPTVAMPAAVRPTGVRSAAMSPAVVRPATPPPMRSARPPMRSTRPVRPPVRLTRRGRVVLLTGLCLLLGVLVVAALRIPASQAADPAGPGSVSGPGGGPPVAVVQPGDTLWSVAARHLPSRDPYGVIEEIRRLNDLSGHIIHPGQELRLPEHR